MATWTKASGYYTLKLEVTQKSQSTANNTSTLQWTLTLLTGSTYFDNVRVGYTVKIDGTTVGSLNYSNATQKSMSRNDSWQIASGTTTVTHNADGTKTIAAGNITAVLNTQTGNIVPNISLASTSALTLTTIPRASTITVSGSSTLMGKTRTITITRASNSFTHTLKYSFGSASGTIASNVATSYNWTVPTSLAAQVASGSIRATGTITCETYSNGTKIGTDSVAFIAQIPPSTATTSASDNTMGKTRAFIISPASSNLTHTITYTFGSGSGTIVTKTASTSISWTVPTSLTQYVATNNASGTGSAVVTTYNGSAEVGTSPAISFTAAIPASTMTKSNATMGKISSFTVTRAGANLSHSITYTFGGASGTAVSKNANETLSWTPPYSLAAQLAITSGTKSGTITYVLHTWNGTAEIGSGKTYTATLSAPTSSLKVPSSMTMGTAASFTITEQDAAFAHTITGTFSGTTATFSTKTTATSVSATFLTATFGPLIPTTKSGTATIKQTVYASSSSSTVVAYNEYTLTLSVPSTKPTATITPSVVTSLASPFNSIYVQNNSKVQVSVNLSSSTGAYIKSASATIDGVTKNFTITGDSSSFSGLTVTSNMLATSGTRTISVTVTDKRGYTGTYSTTISVVAYSNPTISAATGESKIIIERSNSSGTADPAGSYLHLKFIRKISAITNNTGYVSYKVGSGTATTISTSTTASVTINQTLNLGWSEHNTYKVTVRVWDKVGYEVTRTVTIPSLNVTLDLRQGGTGVGIGMFSQGTSRVDIAWPTYIDAGIYPRVINSHDAGASSGYYTRMLVVPRYTADDILSGTPDTTPPYATYFRAWLTKICQDYGLLYGTANLLVTGVAQPSTRFLAQGNIYDIADTVSGLPRYCSFVAYPEGTGMTIIRFGTYEGTWYAEEYVPNGVKTGTLTYVSNNIITSAANLGMTLKKSGKVVTLNATSTTVAGVSASSLVTVANIPTGFRPTGSNAVVTAPQQSGSTFSYMSLYATTDGLLRVIKSNTSTGAFRATMTWITA